MLVIGVLFLLISLLIKMIERIVKVKAGLPFLMFLIFPIIMTLCVFFVDRIFTLFFDGELAFVGMAIALFYLPLNIEYNSVENPIIILVSLIVFGAVIYLLLLFRTLIIGEKRYFHFKNFNVYLLFSEFRLLLFFEILSVQLIYSLLYYFFYSEQFVEKYNQIFLSFFCLGGITWIVLALSSYVLVRKLYMCYQCLFILQNKEKFQRIYILLDWIEENEVRISGYEIDVSLERCIQIGIVKLRKVKSIFEVKEDDVVCVYFEPFFVEMIRDREEILEKGLFFEKYFDGISFV